MLIGNLEVKGKIFIAPLAGYTNVCFRKIMKKAKASMVFSEMVSAKGLIYENALTQDYLITDPSERPVAIQLFGSDPSDMAKATKIVLESTECDIIDINMGCPVRKVSKQGAGSELLSDVSKVYDIVKAVVDVAEKYKKSVSVKIRAGIDHNHINCVDVARAIERAGASLITIHGRTKSDLFSGSVNLDYIKLVKDSVSIPVIGNGDIKTVFDAQRMLDYTGCDGIMIGRGCIGNPWFIENLYHYFNNDGIIIKPTEDEILDMIIYHYQELKKIKSEKNALLEMRSIACFYLKGFNNIKAVKVQINNCKSDEEFINIINSIRN